ncbi:MAG: response regulator transcription factor [Schwartzia sp.]|nr:response regulator transcription factor [Schwartzia sp. (in: firmicutes)]
MSIKILIADDHALLRQGIKRVLNAEEDIEVVGEAANGQEALAHTLVQQPDILLLDLNMPELPGFDVMKQLTAAKSRTKVIVLTIYDNDNYVLEMLRNGAMGYLLKDVEPEMLVRAIHVVQRGGAFVYPRLADRIFGSIKEDEDINARARQMWKEGRAERLTSREMDVLGCIAKGFSNQDIAHALFVSEKTVKNHLTNIFRKINVNDRTQALIYALKNRIMTLE